MKYIVKVKQVCYGYIVVEAENKREALKKRPYVGEFTVTDGYYSQGLDAIPFNEGDKAIVGMNHFMVVKPHNAMYSIRKWFRRFGWKPALFTIPSDISKTSN